MHGGIYDDGTLFRVDTAGNNYQMIHNFDGNDPGKFGYGTMLLLENGHFYGMLQYGGDYNDGVIFEYDPIEDMYYKKYSFNHLIEGANPFAGLIMADNGKFYGTTQNGGTFNDGTFFEYDSDINSVTVLVNFNGASNGRFPSGNLFQANNGKLYGTTTYGGASDKGVLFEYDPLTNIYTKLVDMNGSSTGTGGEPYCAVIQAQNGKLYGTTKKGTIFQYDISLNQYTTVFSKTSTSGGAPVCTLIEAGNGKLYGTMSTEGVNGDGTLFEFDYNTGLYTKLADFDEITTGKLPKGTMIEADNGRLYGATTSGGSPYNYGTLYEFDYTTGQLNSLYTMTNSDLGVGIWQGALIEYPQGVLTGLTSSGGASATNGGTIFEFNLADNSYHKIIDIGRREGNIPSKKVIQTSNGKIYGVTLNGGLYNNGTIYSLDPGTNQYVAHADFNSSTNGSTPYGNMVEASNGKIYGTTNSGGANGNGTIYVFDPITDSIVVIEHLNLLVTGNDPTSGIIEASNGKLYGCTSSGGINGNGVLYEIDPISNTFTKKQDFDFPLGSSTQSAMVEHTNGKLYGVSCGGGTDGGGVLFEYDFTVDTLIKHYDFASTASGTSPYGDIVIGPGGNIYGTTTLQGMFNAGAIFSYDPLIDTLIKHADFNGPLTGDFAYGLVYSSNGKIYGLSAEGGPSNLGTLFEFDPSNNDLIAKINFDGVNTGSISNGTLSEVIVCYPTYSLYIDTTLCSGSDFTFPDGSMLTSILTDTNQVSTLSSVIGCDSVIVTSIHIETIDYAIIQDLTSLTSAESNAILQWLDCGSSFTPIFGETDTLFVASTTGDYALRYQKNSCVDTSVCITIEKQDFYDMPGYIPMSGEVFASPVSNIGICDAWAEALAIGGIPPYSFDWYTQPNNSWFNPLDSLCYGMHVLKISDNIEDSVLVNYYITDSINFFVWADTSATSYIDTAYVATENCLLDFTLPIDSVSISYMYYISSISTPPGDLCFIELHYYQNGNLYTHQDTIFLSNLGTSLIYFSIYCPSKSINPIRTFLLNGNYPTFLGLNITQTLTPVLLPNPTSGIATLSGIAENTSISLYDVSGNLITSFIAPSLPVTIDATPLATGLYFLTVANESGVSTVRLVKE